MQYLLMVISLIFVSACSHSPKLVWVANDAEQQEQSTQTIDLTRETPLQQAQAMQKTHSMMDYTRMAAGESVSLYPLDGPVPNPFENRFPGQGNGFVATTTTSGGYPVRDTSVVVYPLYDTPAPAAITRTPLTRTSTTGGPVMITANDAPTSLTGVTRLPGQRQQRQPVLTMPVPVSAQAPLPTPFTNDGQMAPNITYPGAQTESSTSRGPRLTGY